MSKHGPVPVVRVGLAGTGFAARRHAAALRAVRGVEVRLVSVCSRDPDRADRFAAEFAVERAHRDIVALLADPGVDVVSVCVPNVHHESIAVAAAEFGKHVICEKPLTGSFTAARPRERLRDARRSYERIRAAAGRTGVHIFYAENWVYAPAMVRLRELLHAHGRPVLDLRAEQSHSGSHAPDARAGASAGGGALLTLGSHAVAAALSIKGAEGARPVSVLADTAGLTAMTPHSASGEAEYLERWACAVIGFSDGSRASVHASFAVQGGIRNRLEVFTDSGTVVSDMTSGTDLSVYAVDEDGFGASPLREKARARSGWTDVAADELWSAGFVHEMQDFVECVASGRDPLSGIDLACDVVDVVYSAYVSAAEGRRIELTGLAPRAGGPGDRDHDRQGIT